MKHSIGIFIGIIAFTAVGFAQTPAESIDRALAAAPRQMKEGATVIKWKDDFTYETLKKGTNKLVCYDRSGEPGRHAERSRKLCQGGPSGQAKSIASYARSDLFVSSSDL